jgi:hypothetical protein
VDGSKAKEWVCFARYDRRNMSDRLALEQQLIDFLQNHDEFKHLATSDDVARSIDGFDHYNEVESYKFHATSCPPSEIEVWNHQKLMKDSEWYRAWYMMLGASKRQMIRERFYGKQVLMSERMMSLKTDDAVVVIVICS